MMLIFLELRFPRESMISRQGIIAACGKFELIFNTVTFPLESEIARV